MKNRVVIFTSNNARIITVEDPTPYAKNKDCLINPDLSAVLKTPPHFWKRDGDKIVPMNLEERNARQVLLDRFEVENEPIEYGSTKLLAWFRSDNAKWFVRLLQIVQTLLLLFLVYRALSLQAKTLGPGAVELKSPPTKGR